MGDLARTGSSVVASGGTGPVLLAGGTADGGPGPRRAEPTAMPCF